MLSTVPTAASASTSPRAVTTPSPGAGGRGWIRARRNTTRRWLTSTTGGFGGSTVCVREGIDGKAYVYDGNNSWSSSGVNFWKRGGWHLFTLVSDGTTTNLYLDNAQLVVKGNKAVTPETGLTVGGFEPSISTLKGWRPGPLDDGGTRGTADSSGFSRDGVSPAGRTPARSGGRRRRSRTRRRRASSRRCPRSS